MLLIDINLLTKFLMSMIGSQYVLVTALDLESLLD